MVEHDPHPNRPGSRLTRRLVGLAGSTAIGNLLLVAAAPILTRIYTPDDYGAFVIILMIIGIADFATGLRYEAAIPLCKAESDALTLANLVVLISACLAILTGLFLFLVLDSAAATLDFSDQAALFWWLPAAFILQGFYHSCNGWLLQQNNVRQLAVARIAKFGTIAAAQIVGGLLTDGNAHALVFALIIGELAGIVVVAVNLSASQSMLFLLPGKAQIVALAWRFRRFPFYSSIAAFLFNSSIMIPAILVGVLFGAAAAGFYGLAQRVMGLPIRFVAHSANQVFTAEIAQIDPTDRKNLSILFIGVVKRLLGIGLSYALIIFILGPFLFSFVFGKDWSNAGLIARYLSPMYLAMFLNQSVQYTLQYFRRQDLLLISNLIAFLLMMLTFIIAYIFSISFEITVLILSLVLSSVYSLNFLLAWAVISGRVASGNDDPVLSTPVD